MRALTLAIAFFAPLPAAATGFTDLGEDIVPRTQTEVRLDGTLRLRAETLANLDLDRGLTPSGEPLFPVPLSDPSAQIITSADLRLRTDLAVYAPFGGVAVKVRTDVLDNLVLGATPDGPPTGTASQLAPEGAFRVKRAYGEALTPLGLLAAGRMGSHWGLGLVTNGGDCADCDSGDAADRFAFVTPLFGHIFAVAYDLSAVGPVGSRRDGRRAVDLDPADDARSVTLAVLRWRNDAARARRKAAGKATFEYGAYVSHRWQDRDVPATYLSTVDAQPIGPASAMARDFAATAVDGWLRLTTPSFRLEAEAALLRATVGQASLVPGVELASPVESTQGGAAIESELVFADAAVGVGLDLGFASGDPAPGFGAFVHPTDRQPVAGDLDGPQVDLPRDARVDNFRFHPDYRIDRILFREIIGTVTDAAYARPHARWRIFSSGPGSLSVSVAAVGSFALFASSTPGGQRPLGVEIDPTLFYESRDGFVLALEHAVLFPLLGLDNPAQGLVARPAQLARLRLAYVF